MNIIKTNIDGAVIIEPKIFGDERGFLLRPFKQFDIRKWQE